MRAALLAPLALVACRAPEPPSPADLDLDIPETFVQENAAGSVVDGPWWENFGSVDLDALVLEALERNRDLRAAALSIDAARAQARIAGSARMPTVDLGLNRNRFKNVFVGLPIPGSSGVLSSTATSWGVSLDVAWEADLWGRVGATVRAAEAQAIASALDFEAARHSLAGQTAKAWIACRLAAGLRDLGSKTSDTYRRDLELTSDRFEAGLVSNFDQRIAKARLESSLAQEQAAEANLDAALRQLETLCGRYPAGRLALDGQFPDAPSLPGVGVPSQLLERRPDLRAAAMRVASADASLEAARKERFPRFVINASTGRISDMIDDLTDDDFTVWSLVTALAQPIFQGGRIDATIDAADANAKALLESYAQVALVAFLEVETALAVEEHLVAQQAALERAVNEAEAARSIAQDRYSSGLDSLSVVLEADRTALDAERSLLNLRAQRLDARVDLYLALGGDLERQDVER